MNFKKENFIAGETYIPASQKRVSSTDLVYLKRACDDLDQIAGKYIGSFEEALPSHFGQKTKALFVNSGSSANLVAVSSLHLKPGDEVITAACAFPTTVNPIVQCGAFPVFIDVNPYTLNAEFETIQKACTRKTKAVVLAHTLGNPYRADQVSKWCHEKGLSFVEDCCDALGATVGGRKVGSFGDYATCSFYPAHHISTAEGGAVLSRNGQRRRTAASFRDWGRDCWCAPGKDNTCKKRFCQTLGDLPFGYDHKYIYSHLGYNLQATDFQAALGLAQLTQVDSFIQARRENYQKLFHETIHLSDYIRPVQKTIGTDPSWFGFPLMCQNGINRTKLTTFLEEHQVGTRLVFSGNLTKQPAYRKVDYFISGDLKNTDLIMENAFWIAVHPNLTDRKIAYMVEMLEKGVKAQT